MYNISHYQDKLFPGILAQTKYTREFETAADDYAFTLHKRKGYSLKAFASIMERLAKGDEKESGPFAYISTHPLTAERIQRARRAAAESITIYFLFADLYYHLLIIKK